MCGRVGAGFKETRIALEEEYVEYQVNRQRSEECERRKKPPILLLYS